MASSPLASRLSNLPHSFDSSDPFDLSTLNFGKSDGLIPAIIQDAETALVLMLGFMNPAALAHTRSTGQVTFFSRTKQRLWTKGETSGNVLNVVEIRRDCDSDTLLIKARPAGPVCHTGADTCFEEVNEKIEDLSASQLTNSLATQNATPDSFLHQLEGIIRQRKTHPVDGSYTNTLFAKGINKIAQKVGEEAVELVIEAKDDNDELFVGEAADLLFHTLVLFAAKDIPLDRVLAELRRRHKR